MQYLVYLTYPLMVFILLWGAKWCKKGEWNEDVTSLSQFKYIQGYMALCIMLHHIGQETCASWQSYPLIPGLEFFVDIGFMFVAVFMFCSGYGLFVSFKNKTDYFNGFFKKRVAPVMLALFISTLLFLLARILLGEPMNPYKVVMYITSIGMCNPYGWFAVAMPLFYWFFYISFKYCKSDAGRIGGVVAGVFLYSLVCSIAGHNGMWFGGEWWYNCVHLYWIGMIFAKYETKILEGIKKHYIFWAVTTVLGTVISFFISQWVTGVVSYYGEYSPWLPYYVIVLKRWVCLISQMFPAFFLVFMILVLGMKVKPGNRFLGFMGTITLEFYLIHGLVLELFSYEFCDFLPGIVRITNVALLIIVVFVPSVILALGMKALSNLILKNKQN